MTAATESKPRERAPLNGVNTPVLFATIDVVRNQPELAKFQFRATNRWITGTHSRSRIEFFSGAGAEHTHGGQVEFDADHPGVLVGADNAPTPVEFLLHAIAACITSGIGNIAAARGSSMPLIPACSWAPTTHRRRWSSCSMRLRPVSPQGSATSLRPGV